MKKSRFINGRKIFLLLLFIVIVLSCKQETKLTALESQEKKVSTNQPNELDSLTISMRLTGKFQVIFNIPDQYHQPYFLDFVNRTNRDTIIFKKIPKYHKKQIIYYGIGKFVQGEIKFFLHHYLVNDSISELNFRYEKSDIYLLNNTKTTVNDLFNAYEVLNIQTTNSKKSITTELDSLFNLWDSNYPKNNFSEINKALYIKKLQDINPRDKKIEDYLRKLEKPVAGKPIVDILYNYIKNNIDVINFKKLNNKEYSREYIKLIAIGVFNFLRFEDNKGDKKYQPAIDWLKTTELYEKDSNYIRKKITPLNNNEFKSRLRELTFSNIKNNKGDLKQIFSKHPSNYYLIDFWATWCAPCIQGVKVMNKMKIPNNLKVISISIDEKKDKEKWIKTTKNLGQSITHWLDENDPKTKDFMDFIEMQSVPRYILIDKEMNLIDQAFYHPQEPQFFSKLQDLNNHKYW